MSFSDVVDDDNENHRLTYVEMKWPSYKSTEIYEGAPLNYVVEKLQYSISNAFHLFESIERDLYKPFETMDEECKLLVRGMVEHSLRDAIKALMAINNQLDSYDSLIDDILNSNYDNINNWMEKLWSDGPLNKNNR